MEEDSHAEAEVEVEVVAPDELHGKFYSLFDSLGILVGGKYTCTNVCRCTSRVLGTSCRLASQQSMFISSYFYISLSFFFYRMRFEKVVARVWVNGIGVIADDAELQRAVQNPNIRNSRFTLKVFVSPACRKPAKTLYTMRGTQGLTNIKVMRD